jgi:hypothetical protein
MHIVLYYIFDTFFYMCYKHREEGKQQKNECDCFWGCEREGQRFALAMCDISKNGLMCQACSYGSQQD